MTEQSKSQRYNRIAIRCSHDQGQGSNPCLYFKSQNQAGWPAQLLLALESNHLISGLRGCLMQRALSKTPLNITRQPQMANQICFRRHRMALMQIQNVSDELAAVTHTLDLLLQLLHPQRSIEAMVMLASLRAYPRPGVLSSDFTQEQAKTRELFDRAIKADDLDMHVEIDVDDEQLFRDEVDSKSVKKEAVGGLRKKQYKSKEILLDMDDEEISWYR
ncbi:hypothetical protein EV702DRAFT_1272538 [Suillus placidus]|uniref:Uncharacterized protein n=1 Tax=Suillus placidus TaxID=48579 RepID=A0A9P7CVS3_9AGAM|nr:hypothetical protein EV702DRAFT_1272538 [Suillus placidus]